MSHEFIGPDFDPVTLGRIESFYSLADVASTRIQVLVVFADGGAFALHGETGKSLIIDVRPAPRERGLHRLQEASDALPGYLIDMKRIVRPATDQEQRDAILKWAQEAHLKGSTHDCGEWLAGLRCMVCGELPGHDDVTRVRYGDENPKLYDAARDACHSLGMPWTDPRTGITYMPPKK